MISDERIKELREKSEAFLVLAESVDDANIELIMEIEELKSKNKLLTEQNAELVRERQHYVDAYISVSDNPIWKRNKDK